MNETLAWDRGTCVSWPGTSEEAGPCPEEATGRTGVCKHFAEMSLRRDIFRPPAALRCRAVVGRLSLPLAGRTSPGQAPTAAVSGRTILSNSVSRWSQPRAVLVGDALAHPRSSATSLCGCLVGEGACRDAKCQWRWGAGQAVPLLLLLLASNHTNLI